MRCHHLPLTILWEDGLDKCSALPSPDIKIGSHSMFLGRLINILSAKACRSAKENELQGCYITTKSKVGLCEQLVYV